MSDDSVSPPAPERPRSEAQPPARPNRYAWVAYAALVAAAALVVVLGKQKRDLVSQVETLRQAIREPRPGMFMPTFNTSTLDGRPVTVGSLPAEGRQVLFVYTTTCPYCLSTIPAWKRIASIADTIQRPRAQVFGVSLDSVDVTRQYAERHALPYPTIRFPEDKLVAIYRAGSVPLTLVLDEHGRTIYSRLGELKGEAAIDSVISAVYWRPPPRPQPAPAPAPASR
ncbi:MAG TPA: TlpA disulfide reductase family protein [Longimicrobium sp.]|jgi:peroxiredoxin